MPRSRTRFGAPPAFTALTSNRKDNLHGPTWRASRQPEGEIEETISWIRTAEEEVTDDDKVKMNSFDRGRIQVLYVPLRAIRRGIYATSQAL